MAERGAFAVRCHKVDASLTDGIGGDLPCALRNPKSTQRGVAVYPGQANADFVVELSDVGIQCLNPARVSVTLDDERLEKQVELGLKRGCVTSKSRTFPVGLI